MKRSRSFLTCSRRALLLACSALAVCFPAIGFAEEEEAAIACSCQITDKGCGCAPCCRLIARPTTEEVKEGKSCRKVNCEKVPIPAITLPWEQGGSPLTLFNCLKHIHHGSHTPSHSPDCAECCETCGCEGIECACGPTRCGTARVVHVLDKEKYDVTKCETTWKVECVAPCCCGKK